MKPRLLALVLVCFASRPLAGWEFARTLPAGVPDAATLAGWERIKGDVDSLGATVSYEFYVNPLRGALYEVTRYRIVRASVAPDGTRGRRAETEKLLWNSHPGTREPIQCFERVGEEWKRLAPGSPQYQLEMSTAIFVYGVHRRSIGFR